MLTIRAIENSSRLFSLLSCIANTTSQIHWSARMKKHLTFQSYSYGLVVMCDSSTYTLGIQTI